MKPVIKDDIFIFIEISIIIWFEELYFVTFICYPMSAVC
jgi:hypothetical protein